jgi:hypothetical protein
VRETFDSLLHNKTQANFVKILRPILESLSGDMEIVISIINEYAGVGSKFTIRIYPDFIDSGLNFLKKKIIFFSKKSDNYVDTGVKGGSGTSYLSGKVYISIYICIYIYVCKYFCMYKYICIYTYVHKYYTYIYLSLYKCIYIYSLHICIYRIQIRHSI